MESGHRGSGHQKTQEHNQEHYDKVAGYVAGVLMSVPHDC
jgi:hypothetical protein